MKSPVFLNTLKKAVDLRSLETSFQTEKLKKKKKKLRKIIGDQNFKERRITAVAHNSLACCL